MYSIYKIIDPRDGTTFYVGATKRQINDRLREHIYTASKKNRGDSRFVVSRKNAIINSILECGIHPVVELLEEVGEDEVNSAEKKHYKKLINEGCVLLQRNGNFNSVKGEYFKERATQQINASFPSDVIDEVKEMAGKEPNVRSFSEMVLILTKEAILERKAVRVGQHLLAKSKSSKK